MNDVTGFINKARSSGYISSNTHSKMIEVQKKWMTHYNYPLTLAVLEDELNRDPYGGNLYLNSEAVTELSDALRKLNPQGGFGCGYILIVIFFIAIASILIYYNI